MSAETASGGGAALFVDTGALGVLGELAFLTGKARAKFLELLEENGALPLAYIERSPLATRGTPARVKLSGEFLRVLAEVRAANEGILGRIKDSAEIVDCEPLVPHKEVDQRKS
jgi:hypothetical protein